MDEIKSALEIALEKAKGISVSEKEIEKDAALEQGKKLAGEYLKNPKFNLSAKLTNPPAGGIKDKNRSYILEGAVSVFLKNIVLPEDKERKKENLRAMEGLYLLKKEKDKLQTFFAQIDQFFDDYIEQRKQVYEHLRRKYESLLRQNEQIKNLEEQMKKQGVKLKIAVEQNPQFQQEWRAILNQLDHDYGTHLESIKKELESMKNIDNP